MSARAHVRWKEREVATYEARSGLSTEPIPVLTDVARLPKYRNRKTGAYASVKEHKRAIELKLLEKAGFIRDLQEQVKFLLIPRQGDELACHYVADFVYQSNHDDRGLVVVQWRKVVEDVKGHRTRDYIIKRKLMLFVHGIRILES